jgi:NADH-quinone oxidoreductase subunit G
MLSYPEVYEDRLLTALVGADDATITEALDAAKRQLAGHADDPSKVAVVLSARHSVEDNFALALVAKQYLDKSEVFLARRADGRGDDILMSEDKNSNTAGVKQVCELLDLDEPKPISELLTSVADGETKYLIALGSDIDVDEEVDLRSALSGLKGLVAICTHEGPMASTAHIALPACTFAETRGTFVNRDGISQVTDKVVEPYGQSFPGWQLAVALARTLGYEIDWKSRADLEQAMLEKQAPATPGEGASGEADETAEAEADGGES